MDEEVRKKKIKKQLTPNEIGQYANIQKFLNKFTSQKTKNGYKAVLNMYYSFLKENPDTYIKDIRDIDSNKEIHEITDVYEKDIIKFWNHIEYLAPKSINYYISALRVYFSDNRIELDKTFWKKFNRRGKGNEALTEEIIPTKFKYILSLFYL